jgi:hypothetical protein
MTHNKGTDSSYDRVEGGFGCIFDPQLLIMLILFVHRGVQGSVSQDFISIMSYELAP